MGSFEPVLSGFWLNFLFWTFSILGIASVIWFFLYYESWYRVYSQDNVTLRGVFSSLRDGDFVETTLRFLRKISMLFISMLATAVLLGTAIHLFMFKFGLFI